MRGPWWCPLLLLPPASLLPPPASCQPPASASCQPPASSCLLPASCLPQAPRRPRAGPNCVVRPWWCPLLLLPPPASCLPQAPRRPRAGPNCVVRPWWCPLLLLPPPASCRPQAPRRPRSEGIVSLLWGDYGSPTPLCHFYGGMTAIARGTPFMRAVLPSSVRRALCHFYGGITAIPRHCASSMGGSPLADHTPVNHLRIMYFCYSDTSVCV